jgi:hypothetical protein
MQLRTAARYSTILEINRAAITEPDLDEIFRRTCGAVRNVIAYDRMRVSLYVPEAGALRLALEGGGYGEAYEIQRSNLS